MGVKGFGDGGVEIGMVLRFSCSSACSVCTALCAYLTVCKCTHVTRKRFPRVRSATSRAVHRHLPIHMAYHYVTRGGTFTPRHRPSHCRPLRSPHDDELHGDLVPNVTSSYNRHASSSLRLSHQSTSQAPKWLFAFSN